MSESNRPGDVPPEMPPEYAEAYRRGYERAYRDASNGAPSEGTPDGPDQPTVATKPAQQAQAPAPPPAPTPVPVPPPVAPPVVPPVVPPSPSADPAPSHRAPAEPVPAPVDDAEHTAVLHTLDGAFLSDSEFEERDRRAQDDPDRPQRPTWFVPAVLGGLVLVLLIAAFGLGKVFSGLMAGNDTSSASDSTLVSGAGTGTGQQPKGPIYNGATQAASISAASASCQAPNAVDAAGNPVSYSPSNVFDGDVTTAWRCNGDGAGQRLVLRLPAQTRLGSLGLVPGYAKTDPTSGADRYAENDRITAVRWSFGNGTSVTQHFNGSAHDRKLQSIRIPPVSTSKVVVHILSSTPGPRHTVAVSEVQLGKVAG